MMYVCPAIGTVTHVDTIYSADGRIAQGVGKALENTGENPCGSLCFGLVFHVCRFFFSVELWLMAVSDITKGRMWLWTPLHWLENKVIEKRRNSCYFHDWKNQMLSQRIFCCFLLKHILGNLLNAQLYPEYFISIEIPLCNQNAQRQPTNTFIHNISWEAWHYFFTPLPVSSSQYIRIISWHLA